MKHIKLFENLLSSDFDPNDKSRSKKPKFNIEDHIIAKNDISYKKKLKFFLTNVVGKIIEIDFRGYKGEITWYTIEYFNVPEIEGIIDCDIIDWENNFMLDEDEIRLATKDEIEHQSIKNYSDKYNL